MAMVPLASRKGYFGDRKREGVIGGIAPRIDDSFTAWYCCPVYLTVWGACGAERRGRRSEEEVRFDQGVEGG